MATTDGGTGDVAAGSARDFVKERLREADSAMSPAELAGEYGCTNGHIRNLMMDLVDDGVAERVERGQYTLVGGGEDGEDAEVSAVDEAEPEGNVGGTEDARPPDLTPQETVSPADGEARSEDPGTGDPEDRESGVGIPIPVSTTTLVVAVVLLVVVAVYLGQRGDQDDVDEESEEIESDEWGTDGPGGGLVGE